VLPVEGLELEWEREQGQEQGLEALEWELELELVPGPVLELEKRQLVGLQGMPLHSADRLSPFCPPTRLLEWYLLATLLESVEH
jgi:hypothetical protein